MLLHRRDEVLDVLVDGREAHVALLRDRAGARHFRRDARDAANLVFCDDRTAREAPHAGVDDADAEAAGLTLGIRRNPAAAAAATSTAAAATTTPPTPAPPAGGRRRGRKVRVRAGNPGVHREPHVGVAAARRLRFSEDDVGEAFELRL